MDLCGAYYSGFIKITGTIKMWSKRGPYIYIQIIPVYTLSSIGWEQ